MIQIVCPNNNKIEREYIIKTLLQDFLGLKVNITFSNQEENTILYYNDSKLIIMDGFWNRYTDDMSYYSLKNIPNICTFAQEKLLNVPIIFGEDDLIEHSTSIYCGVDIFASSFFMLTRWEEFLLGRENNGVCDEKKLFAVKNNLQKRPIVNEYIDLLIVLLQKINLNIKRPNKHNVYITHDVDRCYLSSFKVLIQNLYPLAFKKKQYKKSLKVFIRFIRYKMKKQNPFDPFDELMDFSDKYGFKNAFYFKACEDKEIGKTYSLSDSIVQNIIKRIQARNYEIGFHPSENTFNNNNQFETEFNRLKKYAKNIEGGRNHMLLYNNNTINQWNKQLVYNSQFGYQFSNGFRCGTCFPFKIFHVEDRKKLNLQEIPFIAMDSVAIRNNWSPEEHLNDIKKTIDIVVKYNGVICLNWHSNLINALERKKHKKIFFDTVNYIVNEK